MRGFPYDGNSNWIQLPSQTWDFSAGFTLEAWVHYDALGGWSRVCDFGSGSRSHNIALHNGAGNTELTFWTHKDGATHLLTAPDVLRTNQWQHLAVTIDPEGKGQILVDGEVVKEGPLPLPTNAERTRNYIGKANDGASSFNGKMSEFRLWRKTRTVDEIKADLYRTLSGAESGLLIHFPMTQASVQNGIIKNNAPGSPDGEYQAAPSWNNHPFPDTHEDTRTDINRLELSGRDHYVQALAEDVLPAQPTDLTQEAWIKTSENIHSTIVTRRNAVAQGWPTLTLIEGKAAIIVDNPTYRQEIKGTTPINDGNWHHVAAVKDDGTYSLYVDGHLENEVTDETLLATAEGNYHIGCHPVTQSYFTGSIAEVRVWNVARQATEIQAAYNRLLDPKDHPNLILYYPLDESTGDTVTDKVSGKSGIIYNVFWETALPLDGSGCLRSDHFGALVQDHVEKETLYVAGDLGVWRSQDSGAHWHPFSKGLPDVHVKDIKIHPRRRLLRAATWGRGLFEIPLDDTLQRPVKLYIRSTLLDRGIYPTQDQLPHPTEPGKTVDYRQGPDIKVSLPDENKAFPLPTEIDVAQYVNELKDQAEGATNLPEVRVYVQVHNRSADIANGVKVTLLRATVIDGKAPDLPANVAQSIRSHASVDTDGWKSLGTQVLDGVKGGLPKIACFTLATEAIATESKTTPTCLLVVLHHEEDPLDSTERDTKQFCFIERKAAIRYTSIQQARIQRQLWNHVDGSSVNNLTSDSRFPFQPDQNEWRTAFEGPTNAGSRYGARLLGWLQPPVTGSYTFWIASDDHSELRLSTDANPLNAKRIASVEGWTSLRQWGKFKSQQSAAIALQGGQTYYLEALHKENGGGDHVAVAWGGPDIADKTVIDASYFVPIAAMPEVHFKDYAIADPTPVILGDSYQGSLVDKVVSDPQKSLTFTKVSGPDWLAVQQDGTLSGTPQATALPGMNSCRVRVSDNQGNSDEAYIGVTVQFPRIGPDHWVLHNEPSAHPGTPATYAFDGDPATIWTTRWYEGDYPHTLDIDLGADYTIGGFIYLPRQDGNSNGRIDDFEFYVSADGTNWGTPVTRGSWGNNSSEKEEHFTPVAGRYIRLHALSEVNGQIFASAAEINVLGYKMPERLSADDLGSSDAVIDEVLSEVNGQIFASAAEITEINYHGEVKRVQSDEYIEIANDGQEPVDLSGWRVLTDSMSLGREQGFTFPAETVLQVGQRFRVYTNEVHDEWGGFSFGSGTAIWNDRGDIGTLYNAAGEVVSVFAYGDRKERTIPDILAAHGVSGCTVDAGPRAVQAQLAGRVDFLSALDQALKSLIEDPAGGEGYTAADAVLDNWDNVPAGADAQAIQELIRQHIAGQTLILLSEDNLGDASESVPNTWIFSLSYGMGDTHYIYVDRNGAKATYQEIS